MTISELHQLCGNIDHRTVFSIYVVGKKVDEGSYPEVYPLVKDKEILQFSILYDGYLVKVYF